MDGKKAIPKYLDNPKTAKEFADRADWKDKRDDCYGAIEDYTRAIELDPKSPELYVDRAMSKGGAGDLRGTIEDCTKALELDPDGDILSITRFFVYSSRAEARYEVGDYQGAIDDATLCIKNNFRPSRIYYIRGNAKIKLGDREGACRDWRKTLEVFQKENESCRSDPAIKFDESTYAEIVTRISSLIAEHSPQSVD